MAADESPTPEERRKVEAGMECLLGSGWRSASVDEKLDVLPHLWRELREEFGRPTSSYPQHPIPRADTVADPLPEEQRMVPAILEVVLNTRA